MVWVSVILFFPTNYKFSCTKTYDYPLWFSVILSEFIISLEQKDLRLLWLGKFRLRQWYVTILKPRHPGEVKHLKNYYAVLYQVPASPSINLQPVLQLSPWMPIWWAVYFWILALVFAFALGLIFLIVRKHKISSHEKIEHI